MRQTPFLRAAIAIALKDLRAELRNRQLVGAMGLFGLLTTMVFYYTLESRPDVRVAALPAVLWVTVVFAGTLGLGRSIAQEHDRGTLDGLLLTPIPRQALFFGKVVVAWLFSFVVAVVVTVALNFLFNVSLFRPLWWAILVVGTLGFAAIGTLLSSMAVYARGRETTLPIIVLPVALPVITAAVNACNGVLNNLPFGDWGGNLLILLSSDLVFLVLAYFLFGFVVEE